MKYYSFILFIALLSSCQTGQERLQGHWHLDSQKRMTINDGDTSIWQITPEEEEIGKTPRRKTKALLDIKGDHAIWDNGVLGYSGIHGFYIQNENIIEIVEADCYLETFEYHFLTKDVIELHSTHDTTIWLATRSGPQDCDRQTDFFHNSRLSIDLLTQTNSSNPLLSYFQRGRINLILAGKEKHRIGYQPYSINPRIEMNGNFITPDDIKDNYIRNLPKVPPPMRDSIKNVILFDKNSSINKIPELIDNLNKIDPNNIYLGFRKNTDLKKEFEIVLERWNGSRNFPNDLSISYKEWIRLTNR